MTNTTSHMKEILRCTLYQDVCDYRSLLTNKEVLQILKEICLDLEILIKAKRK